MSAATTAIPTIQAAILQQGGGKLAVVYNAPVPKTLPGWLLVRNIAVSLNPCDFKMVARFPTLGLKDGVDFAGTVVAVGDGVTGFSVGDRVFGCVPSNKQDDSESGSFSEYIKVEAIYTLRIPPTMTFETAMALNPACICTVALALHQSLGLPATPDEAAELSAKTTDTVLVYGGSSSVGLLAIQILKLLGHHVVTTCSPHNFQLVKQYGADAVFDYRSKTCAADIRAYTKNKLRRVIDPFGEAATTSLCYEAIGRAGGIYCSLETYQLSLCTRRTVKHSLVMGPAILGRGVLLPEPYGVPPDPELHEWSKRFFRSLQGLIDENKIKPLPMEKLQPGGFETVITGLEILKSKQVSGKKLVVRVTQQ
ncbi:chaperonin 10-like protein [Lasiosphaeria ovina]|uniref:Chaperonin 10-like protein n=1 Tax=Lasiosphaeria ovina TaxID=92902 RepID=A0AAE0K4M4_9PEZI|nr:chaperonin 10-like protein [Lasiosphaeria ovina]